MCGYNPALLFRWTAGYCLWCCAVYIGELWLLLICHCCIMLPELFTQLCLSVHQYATSACVRLWPGPRMKDLWLEGDLANRGPRRKDKMRREKRDQNLSVCSDWVILDSTVSTFRTELQKSREGGSGDIFDEHATSVWVRMCVCAHMSATHSNHLNYFL